MPVAFAFAGLAILLIVSGFTDSSLAEILRGERKGVSHDSPLDSLLADVGSGNASLTDLGNPIATDLAGNAQGVSHQVGLGTFEGKPVALWIIPILQYAKRHGWTGSVTSGYRSAADQARVCATGVKPCAKPGTSHHQGKMYPSGAVDVSNPEQLSQILRSSPYGSLLVWAGAKDPPHFSHPYNGGY